WARLFGEVVAALRVDLDGDEVTLDVALSRLQLADRDTRSAAADAVSKTLEPGLRTRGFIVNTLVYDKSVEDRLRSYPHWLARRRDVLTMAHELGHGLHAALAQPQGVYHQGTPLTLAETASVFGETLVFERLLAAAATDDQRLSLLAERLDASMATVFRQMSM